MRIISGKRRGKKLHTYPGNRIRPTADRLREAIFNILSSRILDSVVLDLYAGTGALGIESLSRGAQSVVFIDNDRQSLSLLKKNITACNMLKETQAIHWDITRNLNCIKASQPGFTLVFMDPPYGRGLIRPTLIHLHDSGAVQHEARIIIEHSTDEIMPQDLSCFRLDDQRKYGKTLVSFFNYVV